ncbi:MAG: hypothetical protein HY706_19405 [Candidatus Hydrogenedentes bacterium]|nr:hypothetical protein [Candidatus Hydrogenedentota bacterium]
MIARLVALVGLTILAQVAVTAAARDLAAERQEAYQQIQAGRVREGASSLLTSLREWPNETAAIDEAVATSYLLEFTLEYLMDDATRRAFVDEVMKAEQEPADDLILTALYLNLDTGLSEKEFSAVSQKLHVLTNSSTPWVRALSLALMASPYYYRDGNLAKNARGELMKQYPDLELTRAVLRGPLYIARKKLASEPAAVSTAMGADTLLAARKNDPVAIAVSTTVDRLQTEKTDEGLLTLTDTAKNAPDAHTRFGCLYMLEAFVATPRKAEVKDTASALTASSQETADATYARIQLLRIAAEDNDAPQARHWCEALLEQKELGTAYTRNLYEDLLKDVSKGAEFLIRAGDKEGAAAVLEKLAAKFPNSVVATQASERVNQLRLAEKSAVEASRDDESSKPEGAAPKPEQ